MFQIGSKVIFKNKKYIVVDSNNDIECATLRSVDDNREITAVFEYIEKEKIDNEK